MYYTLIFHKLSLINVYLKITPHLWFGVVPWPPVCATKGSVLFWLPTATKPLSTFRPSESTFLPQTRGNPALRKHGYQGRRSWTHTWKKRLHKACLLFVLSANREQTARLRGETKQDAERREPQRPASWRRASSWGLNETARTRWIGKTCLRIHSDWSSCTRGRSRFLLKTPINFKSLYVFIL